MEESKDELMKALEGVEWVNPRESFVRIAEILMWKYAIKKGDKRYAIVEIEFYLYSKDHKDYITYPRTIKAGRWFFHQSGVDLTFESNEISFGGILIRGLYKLHPITKDEERYIFGPQKCVNELWDNFSALEPSVEEYPIIVPHENELNIVECKRCINIKEASRISKIKYWAERLNKKVLLDAEGYMKEMFENEDTQLYRFFNLPDNEDPCTFKKIPYASRPKKVRKAGGQLLPI